MDNWLDRPGLLRYGDMVSGLGTDYNHERRQGHRFACYRSSSGEIQRLSCAHRIANHDSALTSRGHSTTSTCFYPLIDIVLSIDSFG